MSFKGLKALITGASSGLGYALATSLIEGGASLVVVTGRNTKALSSLVSLGEKQGVEVISCEIDLNAVDAEDALEALFAEIGKKHELNLVIACAGVSTTANSDGLEDLFEIERSINVNVKGAVSTLYLGAKAMLDKDTDGHLVVISSLASLVCLPSSALYGASKLYLNAYAKALGQELKDSKIKVTTVIPGFIDTPMSRRFVGRHDGMISAKQASLKILKGALKGKRELIFPYYLYLGIMLSKLLPLPLQTFVLKLFDFKVIQDPERQAYEQSLKDTQESLTETLEDTEKSIEEVAKNNDLEEASSKMALSKTKTLQEDDLLPKDLKGIDGTGRSTQEQNLSKQIAQDKLNKVACKALNEGLEEPLAERLEPRGETIAVKSQKSQNKISLNKEDKPLKKDAFKKFKAQNVAKSQNAVQKRAKMRKNTSLLDKTIANNLNSKDTERIFQGEDFEGFLVAEDVGASRAKRHQLSSSLKHSKTLKACHAQELHLTLESSKESQEPLVNSGSGQQSSVFGKKDTLKTSRDSEATSSMTQGSEDPHSFAQSQNSVSKLKPKAQAVSLKDKRNLQKLAKASVNAQSIVESELKFEFDSLDATLKSTPSNSAYAPLDKASVTQAFHTKSSSPVKVSRPVGLVVSTNLQRSGRFQRRGTK